MHHVVSASRRTDIPAFHSAWFMRRVAQGWAWSVNPFNGHARRVSLAPREVAAIVFWSKDYRPLLPHLDELDAAGYRTLFHFTITGLPRSLEPWVPDTTVALETMAALSRRYGPERVLWRFDPIVLTAESDSEATVKRFDWIAQKLAGLVTECYLSFLVTYRKVVGNLHKGAIRLLHPGPEERIQLTAGLVAIARAYGITVHTCCGDELLAAGAHKAHCIAADRISRVFGTMVSGSPRPTRKECGCSVSFDIGHYRTCGHACLYCYATESRGKARGGPMQMSGLSLHTARQRSFEWGHGGDF